MFRKFVIAVFTAAAAILETAADAIAATLPPPAADGPRLRLVASGRLWVPVTTAPRNSSSTNVTSKSTFHATILRVSSRVPAGVAARIDPGPARASATRPKVLSRAEADTLIAACPAASRTGIRNRALITLL